MIRSAGFGYLLGVFALVTACGSRSSLLHPELYDGADDDLPPLGSGKAGASSKGGRGATGGTKPTGGASGSAGGKGSVSEGGADDTPQAGEPNEGGVGGSIDQPPLSDHDYYVNPELGSDDNPGTEDAPFKTIEHAAGVAIGGDTIWLEEGAYTWNTEPAFRDDRTIDIADGVALRGHARSFGYVNLLDQVDTAGKGGFAFRGDAKLSDMHLVGFNPAIRADHGKLELERVSFESPWSENICNYGANALIMLTGSAKMKMQIAEQGLTLGYSKCIARLDDEAALHATGGLVANAEWNSYPDEVAIFSAWGHSRLTLENVSTRDNQLSIIGAWDQAKVVVDHVNFQGSTIEAGRAPTLIHVSDDSELEVKASWFDGADFQTCVGAAIITDHEHPAGKVRIESTSLSHCQSAVALRSDTEAVLVNVNLSENGSALSMSGGRDSGSLLIQTCRIAKNGSHGLVLEPGKGKLSVAMHHSVVIDSHGDGIRVGREKSLGGVLSLDLGTLDSPGYNRLSRNGVGTPGSVNLRIFGDVAPTLFAVGNYWDASAQGSGSDGYYSVNDLNSLVYDADHDAIGTNYAFEAAESEQVTLRLAERASP